MADAAQVLADALQKGDSALATALAEALAANDPSGSYTKAEANYRRAEGEEKCGNCVHYDSGSESCGIVAGTINPEDTCDYWKGSAVQETPHEQPGESPLPSNPLAGGSPMEPEVASEEESPKPEKKKEEQ